MKKLLITALVAASTTSTFAIDYMQINGKKITMNDTRSTLIQKLGKPESGTSSNSRWNIENLNIYAEYNKNALADFSVWAVNNKPSGNYININGKNIYLGKDTIKTATTKLKYGCFGFNILSFKPYYSLTPRATEYKPYNITLTSIGEDGIVKDFDDQKGIKALANIPVSGFKFSITDPDMSQGCNYG